MRLKFSKISKLSKFSFAEFAESLPCLSNKTVTIICGQRTDKITAVVIDYLILENLFY